VLRAVLMTRLQAEGVIKKKRRWPNSRGSGRG